MVKSVAKKKVSRKTEELIAKRRGPPCFVVNAFKWHIMTSAEKEAAIKDGVLLAVFPHEWESLMRDQQIQSQARDNLREELRVAKLKLSDLDERFRNEQTSNMHHVEALRSELSKAREEVTRITRAMHALIDGIVTPRPQLVHSLPDGRAFRLDEETKQFRPA